MQWFLTWVLSYPRGSVSPFQVFGVSQIHRCRSKQIFRGAKEFCLGSHKLSRKALQKSVLQNKKMLFISIRDAISCQFGRHYFQIKACWAPFLLRFSGSFGRLTEIFTDFARIFTKSKLLGVRLYPLHPHLMHQCSNVWLILCFNKIYSSVWRNHILFFQSRMVRWMHAWNLRSSVFPTWLWTTALMSGRIPQIFRATFVKSQKKSFLFKRFWLARNACN